MDVASACFDVAKWHEESQELQHDLKFIMARAQKPLEFRANPFYTYNFETFSQVSRLFSDIYDDEDDFSLFSDIENLLYGVYLNENCL